MTIADKLYRNDPETLCKIIVIYQLEGLARLYFRDMIIDKEVPLTREDANEREITSLMRPGSYTGRVERRRGALRQPHRPTIK